jgi:hypothetical protein
MLADNKLTERVEWDGLKLAGIFAELDQLNVDLDLTGFDKFEIDEYVLGPTDMPEAEAYTRKIETPIYEPKGESPTELDLFDRSKTTELLSKIERVDIPANAKEFLRLAAERHTVFRFDKIAEYYAHAPAEVQDLMEQSALVIIDFAKAIESGFVKLTERLLELAKEAEDA